MQRRLWLIAVFGLAAAVAWALWPAKHLDGDARDRYRRLFGDGRYAEALREAKSIAHAIKVYDGDQSADYADAVFAVAKANLALANYSEAIAAAGRAAAVREQVLGPDAPALAEALSLLAEAHRRSGALADAEQPLKRALGIWQRLPGDEARRDIAAALNNLASVYSGLGRYAQAEPLYERAKAIGTNPRDIASNANNLATDMLAAGRFEEAEKQLVSALAMQQQAFAADDPDLAQTLSNLSVARRNLGRPEEAITLSRRALEITESAFGTSHPRVADVLMPLANALMLLKRFDEAAPVYERARAIRESLLGETHPQVAQTLKRMAALKLATGATREAVTASRRASRIMIDRFQLGLDGSAVDAALLRGFLDQHLTSLDRAAAERLDEGASAESFVTAQWEHGSSAARAVVQMAARFATGDDELARAVRSQQDVASELRRLDRALLAEIAAGSSKIARKRRAQLQAQVKRLEMRLSKINSLLERDFPRYRDLVSPQPLAYGQVQSLLAHDEAVLLYHVGDRESHVYAVTREGFESVRIPLDADEVSRRVAEFRRGLDVQLLARAFAPEAGENDGRMQLFDVAEAHALYKMLVGPVEQRIRDKPHLIVIPSGALSALPFHLLVTGPSAFKLADMKSREDLVAYRDVAWLLRRHAATVLPSLTGLKALRTLPAKKRAPKPLIAFADPVFDPADIRPSGETPGQTRIRAAGALWQGANVRREDLAGNLPRLPETAAEVKAVAASLSSSADDVYLGANATEAAVKAANLADYRIVYFATHSLVSGDVQGLSEPALVLTLPAAPTPREDGLLTASEVAQLELNADWVVLSACDTMAGEASGGEALTGLARAFIFAGARALLVSHWKLETVAAMQLTTATFDALAGDSRMRKADAIRRAMLSYLEHTSEPHRLYPAYWAPFQAVGADALAPGPDVSAKP